MLNLLMQQNLATGQGQGVMWIVWEKTHEIVLHIGRRLLRLKIVLPIGLQYDIEADQ